MNFKNFNNSESFLNLAKWIKLISITTGSLIVIQILTLLSSILIVRLLNTEEYAWYTIANTMLGTLTVLSDTGISSSVMAQGGQLWQNRIQLSKVVKTGLSLRKKFAIGSLIVTTPFLFYLLIHHNASIFISFIICLSLMPAFYAALSDNILEIPLKLHQQIIILQKNQLQVSIARILLLGSFMWVLPFTSIALLGNGIPRIWANRKLKKVNKIYIDDNVNSDSEIKYNILKFVKKILPSAIYYCISGQITIWLISIYGNTKSLANIGALGRLSVLFVLLGTLFKTIFVPQFSKIPNSPKSLLISYFKIQTLLIFVVLLVIGTAYIFSNEILFVLGNNYKGLDFELMLVVILGGISLIGDINFNLYSVRGWAIYPSISISISFLFTILGVLFFDMSKISGTLFLGMLTTGITTVIGFIFTFFKIKKIEVLN